MTFHEALSEARAGKLLSRRAGSGMNLYMEKDDYGFIRTGIDSPKKKSIIWFSGARLHEDDMAAKNWKIIKRGAT